MLKSGFLPKQNIFHTRVLKSAELPGHSLLGVRSVQERTLSSRLQGGLKPRFMGSLSAAPLDSTVSTVAAFRPSVTFTSDGFRKFTMEWSVSRLPDETWGRDSRRGPSVELSSKGLGAAVPSLWSSCPWDPIWTLFCPGRNRAGFKLAFYMCLLYFSFKTRWRFRTTERTRLRTK